MEEKILNVIEKVRPYLNMDGGDIEFVKYEDGYIYIKLYGACANCLYQDNTINENLLTFFKEEIPDIKGIINVNFSDTQYFIREHMLILKHMLFLENFHSHLLCQ